MNKVIPSLILSAFLFSCGGKSAEKPAASGDTLKSAEKPERVVGVARIEPVSKIYSINTDASGIVDKLSVDAGSHVKKGDIILKLASTVEEAQLRQSESKLAAQNSRVLALQSTLKSLEVKLANAETTYKRNQALLAQGAVTRQAFDDSKASFESLQSDVASAKANSETEKAKLGELQADIGYYRAVLARKSVTAPENGTLLSLEVRPSQNISGTTLVGDFAPDGPLMAITEVDELFADQIIPGLKAFVRPQGSEKVLSEGKVIFAAPYLRKKSLFSDKADNLEDRRVREVRVQLDKSDSLLIGSRVECVIRLK